MAREATARGVTRTATLAVPATEMTGHVTHLLRLALAVCPTAAPQKVTVMIRQGPLVPARNTIRAG